MKKKPAKKKLPPKRKNLKKQASKKKAAKKSKKKASGKFVKKKPPKKAVKKQSTPKKTAKKKSAPPPLASGIAVALPPPLLADAMTMDAGPATPRQKLALCIGINDYGANSLNGCLNDIADWTTALQSRGFTVTQLANTAATKDKIIAAIQATLEKARSGDLVVLQFSGHGTYILDPEGEEDDQTDECLCPHDIRTNGPITNDKLDELLAARPSGVEVVFIADSCFSGQAISFNTSGMLNGAQPDSVPLPKVRFLPPATFLPANALAQLPAFASPAASDNTTEKTILLSSCDNVEPCYDATFNLRPNGAFTFVALQSLKSLPSSATYRDWHDDIRSHLPTQQFPQSPRLKGTPGMKNKQVFA